MIRIPIAPATPSHSPYAVGGRAASRAVTWLTVTGPRTADRVQVVLDTGSDCCLFAEWVAWRIGLRRSANSPALVMGSSLGGAASAWFDRVGLRIDDPNGVTPPVRWDAVVGFTPPGSFGGK